MLSFDTERLPPQERAHALEEALRWGFLPTMPYLDTGPNLRSVFEVRQYGDLRVGAFDIADARGVARRPALSPDATEPLLTLHIDFVGGLDYERTDAQVHGNKHAIVFSETTTALSQHTSGHRSRKVFFTMPSDRVGIGSRWRPSTAPLSLSTDNPFASVLITHLRSLARSMSRFPDRAWADLPDVTIGLVRSVLASVTADDQLLRESQAMTLARRVLLFIDCHATDPDLSASRIAAAHHISVRYLYLVLEREGVALGDYIRQRRIDHAASLLRSMDKRNMTIAAVAHACGFYDHAHFSRAFRSATGMTPSQWRRVDDSAALLHSTERVDAQSAKTGVRRPS